MTTTESVLDEESSACPEMLLPGRRPSPPLRTVTDDVFASLPMKYGQATNHEHPAGGDLTMLRGAAPGESDRNRL